MQKKFFLGEITLKKAPKLNLTEIKLSLPWRLLAFTRSRFLFEMVQWLVVAVAVAMVIVDILEHALILEFSFQNMAEESAMKMDEM